MNGVTIGNMSIDNKPVATDGETSQLTPVLENQW